VIPPPCPLNYGMIFERYFHEIYYQLSKVVDLGQKWEAVKDE